MRIGICLDGELPDIAAHTVQTVGMCDAFSALGHEVILFSRRNNQVLSSAADIFEWYGVRHTFSMRWMTGSPQQTKRLFGMRVAAAVRQSQVDLVYSRCLHSAFFSTLFGVPTIYDAHTLPRDGAWLTQQTLQMFSRQKNARGIIAISSNLKNDLQFSGVNPRKILVLPTGGPCYTEDKGLSLSGLFPVVYAGNTYPGKVLEILIPLAERTPWATFHISGIALDNSLPSNIHFHGHFSPARIRSFMSSGACLIAPYSTPILDSSGCDITRWTSPLKIFEYMAVKRPIVTTDLPGVREVLTDASAFILQGSNLDQWEEALLYVAKHPEEADNRAQLAFANYHQRYTWKTRASKVLEHVQMIEAQRANNRCISEEYSSL